MKKIRIALCGSGRIGRVHAVNIAADARLDFAWVTDPMIASAREVAGLVGATATASMDEVLTDDALDALVICSPTATHIDLIVAAQARGIAVLCEKPIDLDLQRVLDSRTILEGGTSPLMMGFNRRFDPNFSALRRRVAAGEIGRLEQLNITSRDVAPAPAGYIAASGGIFRDMSIHDLDMARFFLPTIVEVTAHGSNVFCDYIKDAGDFDSAVIVLRGGNGELVTITNSRHSAYGYDQRLEAFGSAGMLSAANVSPTTVRKFTAEAVDQADAYEPFFLERYASAYRLELDHFIGCIQSEAPCTPGFADGLAALELADAAARSARTGTSVAVSPVVSA